MSLQTTKVRLRLGEVGKFIPVAVLSKVLESRTPNNARNGGSGVCRSSASGLPEDTTGRTNWSTICAKRLVTSSGSSTRSSSSSMAGPEPKRTPGVPRTVRKASHPRRLKAHRIGRAERRPDRRTGIARLDLPPIAAREPRATPARHCALDQRIPEDPGGNRPAIRRRRRIDQHRQWIVSGAGGAAATSSVDSLSAIRQSSAARPAGLRQPVRFRRRYPLIAQYLSHGRRGRPARPAPPTRAGAPGHAAPPRIPVPAEPAGDRPRRSGPRDPGRCPRRRGRGVESGEVALKCGDALHGRDAAGAG